MVTNKFSIKAAGTHTIQKYYVFRIGVKLSPPAKRFFAFSLKDEVKTSGTQSLAKMVCVWWNGWFFSWRMMDDECGLCGCFCEPYLKEFQSKRKGEFKILSGKNSPKIMNLLKGHILFGAKPFWITNFWPISPHYVYALSSPELNFNSLDYVPKKREVFPLPLDSVSIRVMVANVRL